MGNLDELQIEIAASSNEAESSITNLTTALKRLNEQLGLSNGTKLTTILNTLAKSANAFADAANSFNGQGFEQAAQGAKKASSAMSEANKSAESYKKILSEIGQQKIDSVNEELFKRDLGKNFETGSFNSVVEQTQKMLPALTQAEETALAISNHFDTMLPALNSVQSSSLAISGNFEKMLPAFTSFGEFTPPDLSTMLEQMEEFVEYIYKALGGMRAIEDKRPGLPDKYYDPIDTTGEWVANNPPDVYRKMEVAAQSARKATEELGDSIKMITDKGMSSNATGNVPEQFKEAENAAKEYGKAAEGAGKKAEEASKKNVGSGDVLSNLVALSHALDDVSKKFGALGDKGISLFKTLVTPLNWAASEYIEKFHNMRELVDGFVKDFQKGMAKMSQFWKKTMRTFTFMLVRKAITAVITEVGNAIQSLAMYSNAMGTAFNTDISNMVADFQYLGRSIVSVFAPLLNYVAPIIDAIVDKIATLLSYIGMLIAALGGSTSFTKAKKNVSNYAESLDSASKSAKNLTMGIDELNILNDSSGSSSSKPYDGWEDAWEDVEIPDWIQDFANKLKQLFKDLFEPIKKAWESAKQYVLDGWKYMTEQMKLLLRDVWRDFMKVWESETVEDIFYQFFMIIGDLERVIGNLAKNFREAWNDANAGYNILMNLATIVDVLINHVRNVTEYMIEWSEGIDFKPLLHSLETLTFGFIKLADFLGGVFEDVMRNVVLKYIEWMIEEGIPHLNKTISEVIAAFNFDKIRQDLVPLEEAFERLLENIDKGFTNALGNLGKQIAEFANSEDFTLFMQRIADVMDKISDKDVEKILTGIGTGILRIADGLVQFVNSDTFMAFIDKLDEWLENATADDIADIMERLAFAIGTFKFAEFASGGLAGFLQFAVMLKSLQNLRTIASGLTAVGGGATVAGGGFATFASAALPIVAIIAGIIIVVYSLVESFGGLDNLITRLKESFDKITTNIKKFADAIGLTEAIDNFKNSIKNLGDKLGNLKDSWENAFDVLEPFITLIGIVLVAAFKIVIDTITTVINIFSIFVDIFGYGGTVIRNVVHETIDNIKGLFEGIGTLIKDLMNGDWQALVEDASALGGKIVEKTKEGINNRIDEIKTTGGSIIDTIKSGFEGRKDEITAFTASGISSALNSVPGEVEETTNTVSRTISGNFASSYANASVETGELFKDTTLGIVNQGLGAVNEADYDTAGNIFATSEYAAYQSNIDGLDFTSLGLSWNTKSSEALKNSGSLFSTANEETSEEGANTFSQTYMDFITNQSLMGEGLNTYGQESGSQLVLGLNTGLADNMDTTTASIDEWLNIVDTALTTNSVMPFSGTVNTKTMEYGKSLVTGLNLGITTNASTSITAIGTWFSYINSAITNKLTQVKTTFNTMLTNIFSGAGWDYDSPITTLFTNVTMSITNNLTILGDNLLNNLLPMFMETYILPFFSIDRWQPLFDVLLNEVLMTNFTQFTEWFNTSMTTWWNEYLLIWFQPAKWNSEIFIPLQKNREQRYKLFIDWWVESLKSWWEEKTMPYFKPTFWDEKVYIPLQKNREKHYKEFIDWWDKSLKDWWDNKTMPYFKDSFWDDEIYTPIKDNLHKHFESFIKWWDETLEDWWNNHTKPYFEEELWRRLFTTVFDVSEDVFEKIKNAIQERIKDAAQSVANACESMTSSLNDVLKLIDEVQEAIEGFGDLGGAVTFNYSGEFASGGFPSAGSLFLAGETGAGAEFVGNIGGRTGVVSNDEITGIADAVYSTGNQESVLLAQLISLTQALLDKDPVVIGDKEIAEMANNGQSQLGMSIIS